MRALLSAGALVDLVTTDNGASSLFMASRNGDLEVVRALLSAGAQMDLVTTHDSSSPLHMAFKNGHLEVVHALLSAGAQVNLVIPLYEKRYIDFVGIGPKTAPSQGYAFK